MIGQLIPFFNSCTSNFNMHNLKKYMIFFVRSPRHSPSFHNGLLIYLTIKTPNNHEQNPISRMYML
jgi:hypothetical protein